MKLLFSIVLLGVVLAVAVPLLKRVQEAASGGGASLDGLPAPPSFEQTAEEAPEIGTMYRWKDANGTLHIESAPPPVGTEVEVIAFTKDASTVTEKSLDEADPSAGQAAPTGASATPSPTLVRDPLSVYSGDGIDELLQRVDDTAKQLQERKKTFDELKEQL